MAPPESSVDSLNNAIDPADVSRKNYLDKIDRYVQKIEAFKFSPRQADVKGLRHSGPQGKVEPLTVIDDPADWKATDWEGREEEYTYHFTKEDVAELSSAVSKVKHSGVSSEQDILQLTRDHFPLPKLAPKLVAIGKEVNAGRGFKLVRGFPVQQYHEDRLGLVLAFWGLGLHLGRPLISQTDYLEDGTIFGSVLNHVTDGRWTNAYKQKQQQEGMSGTDRSTPTRKVDKSRLAFHTDQGATDLIALLSISAAPQGGESKWVSAVAIHNELLRRGRQDLVEELSKEKTWYTPKKVSQQAYERNADGSFAGYEEEVPFAYHNGYLSVHFEANKYQDIQLTPLQEEAVWAVAALAESPEFHLSKKLQPGDIEIVHNPTIFHSRGEVIDGETPREKRHLLRWWVATDANKRPIPPLFAPRSNVQATGGFVVPKGSSQLRTIALQSIAGKAYANVLSARLSKWLADNLLDEQCGFRPSRSTVDALFSLRLLCDGAWDKGQTLHICMLDLTKAFDSVDREMAWQILLSRGAPPKLVALIRDLHTHHSAVIRSEVDSAPVGTSVGFKQGCVLAPPLFNVCLDSVIRQLLPQLQQLGVTICYKIDGQLMHCKKPTEEVLMWILMYADDIFLGM